MYKIILRPIRTLMIKLLFNLLNVQGTTAGIAIYEDLPNFEDSPESIELSNGMKYRHSIALAGIFLNEDYKNYLYYLMLKVQRDNIKTISPFKRDAQTATVLFILRHIEEMRQAQQILLKKKGPKFRDSIKETLKRKKKD